MIRIRAVIVTRIVIAIVARLTRVAAAVVVTRDRRMLMAGAAVVARDRRTRMVVVLSRRTRMALSCRHQLLITTGGVVLRDCRARGSVSRTSRRGRLKSGRRDE